MLHQKINVMLFDVMLIQREELKQLRSCLSVTENKFLCLQLWIAMVSCLGSTQKGLSQERSFTVHHSNCPSLESMTTSKIHCCDGQWQNSHVQRTWRCCTLMWCKIDFPPTSKVLNSIPLRFALVSWNTRSRSMKTQCFLFILKWC